MKTLEKTYKMGTNRFRNLVSYWDNRPDLEHQQALLRVGVGLIAFAYLLYTILGDRSLSGDDWYVLFTSGTFFIIAFFILLWLTIVPGVSVVRRVLGIVIDNGATTAVLYFHGMLGTPLFIIYLWVSFGNGFRFGQRYLALSATLSVLGFSFVVLFSDRYEMNSHVTFGLFAGLVVLPLYVASLLNQLTNSLEVARKANKAKSNFLATMSHEIRTPLNGMVGVTEILSRTDLSRQQLHYVNLISRSSEWLMRVITDGLDFSKIEAGEFLISSETYNFSSAMVQFCALYQGLQKDREVQFTSSLDNNLPEMVVGDQLRLNQVLSNLVSNSLKFTKKGEVHFSAKVILRKRDGVRIQFTVTDTGLGIAPDKQAMIFEPFRQADSGVAQKYGGTGLGLAIASRIIDLMGGKLILNSVLGEGASFSFNLFFPEPSEETVREVEDEMKKSTLALGWTRPPKLLVVEDHEINREVVVNQLENMHCSVALAVNGFEAVEYLKENTVDLVLMDCQMPQMDGYTATRMIREKEGRGGGNKRLPIVALTAHVTVEDREKCINAGMDDYLGKPFTAELLRKKLHHWLQPLLSDQAERVEPASPEEEGTIPSERVKEGETVKTERGENKVLLHDLKNMLLAIYGSAELSLAAKDDSASEKRHMERIHRAVTDANRIVETLAKNCTEKTP
ncbi:response regulator [Desulforhopalus sp. 52FAK]